jgi:hypothetical protein
MGKISLSNGPDHKVLAIMDCSWRWFMKINEREPVDVMALTVKESRQQTN